LHAALAWFLMPVEAGGSPWRSPAGHQA
jgi:hypothetical protein